MNKEVEFYATVYYRTVSNCNTWMVNILAINHSDALDKTKLLFSKRRPKAVKIDRIEIKA